MRAARAVAWIGLVALLGGCGGASEPEPEPSTEALVASACEKLGALECATNDTEPRCLDELHQKLGFAEQEGCQAELRAYVKCVSAGPVDCHPLLEGGVSADFDEACNDLNDAFFYCYTKLPPECGVGMGVPGYTDSACSVKCSNLSSLCHGPEGGPYACTCDSGPHAGTAFESSDCGGMSMIWATGHHCT